MKYTQKCPHCGLIYKDLKHPDACIDKIILEEREALKAGWLVIAGWTPPIPPGEACCNCKHFNKKWGQCNPGANIFNRQVRPKLMKNLVDIPNPKTKWCKKWLTRVPRKASSPPGAS